MTLGLLQVFTKAGHLCLDVAANLPAVFVTVVLATIVESLPITRWVDDNFSVPFVAALSASLLLSCS